MRNTLGHFIKSFRVNRAIRAFVVSDLVLWGGWLGFVSPVLAIFIINKIPGATPFTVGLTAAIYWLVKAIVQMPVAVYIDKKKGEKDDFYVLITSLLLAGLSAFVFALAPNIEILFLASFIQGIAFGLYIPSWSALFSRHLDKEHYALDRSIDSTLISVVTALTAILGGAITALIDFKTIFIATGIMSLLSAAVLMTIPEMIFPKAIDDSENAEKFVRPNRPR